MLAPMLPAFAGGSKRRHATSTALATTSAGSAETSYSVVRLCKQATYCSNERVGAAAGSEAAAAAATNVQEIMIAPV